MHEPFWTSGDRVVHRARPEWGLGHVLDAKSEPVDGAPAQTLKIRFERGGTKILSTAHAKLEPAPDAAEGPKTTPPARTLGELPEPATDPFLALSQRLANTLALYRFEGSGTSLMDWATAQTLLPDPLVEYSRNEIEAAFQGFSAALDRHLDALIRQALRQDPSLVAGLARDATGRAKQRLSTFHTRR